MDDFSLMKASKGGSSPLQIRIGDDEFFFKQRLERFRKSNQQILDFYSSSQKKPALLKVEVEKGKPQDRIINEIKNFLLD